MKVHAISIPIAEMTEYALKDYVHEPAGIRLKPSWLFSINTCAPGRSTAFAGLVLEIGKAV